MFGKNPIHKECKGCMHLLSSQVKRRTMELKIKSAKKEKQLLEELLNRRAQIKQMSSQIKSQR